MPRIIQVRHSQPIHPPTHVYSSPLMPLYNNPISYMPNIQEQEKTPNQNALSPSSSLRLKGLTQARGSLAQASSLRLGESSIHRNSGLCAFSLRRDSPRLSETHARLKLSWSLERPLTWKGLGEGLGCIGLHT